MAQLTSSAASAGTSIFDLITKSVNSIGKTVNSTDDALSVLNLTTSQWKQNAMQDAALNQLDRRERYLNQKAIEIALDQDRILQTLEGNPRVEKLFTQIKKRHEAMLKEMQDSE